MERGQRGGGMRCGGRKRAEDGGMSGLLSEAAGERGRVEGGKVK